MDIKEVAKQIQKLAPILGSVIGGPVGGAVGGGVSGLISIVGSAFGLTEDEIEMDPSRLSAAITADPEAEVKLVEIQTTHKTRIEEILLERDKAYLADRQGARLADVEKTKATGKRDANLYVLAWTIVVGFFGLTACLMFVEVESNQAALLLFGSLAAGFGSVVGYFFGSSKSSSDKTALMAKQ